MIATIVWDRASSVGFWIPGFPEAQARPRIGRSGKVYSPKSSWRKLVSLACSEVRARLVERDKDAWLLYAEPPVSLAMHFFLERPKSHFRVDGTTRSNAPMAHTSRPDIDNLIKSTMDGIVDSGMIGNDATVLELIASKMYNTCLRVNGVPVPAGALIGIGVYPACPAPADWMFKLRDAIEKSC